MREWITKAIAPFARALGRGRMLEKLTSASPTAHYRPHNFGYSIWGDFILHQLPPFHLGTARLMLSGDPIVNFSLNVRNAALSVLDVEVKAKNPRVKAWVEKQWRTIWNRHRPKVLSAKKWGFAALEATYRMELLRDEEGNPMGRFAHIDSIKDFAPEDVRPREYCGKVVGFRVKDHKILSPRGAWLTFNAEFGSPYGTGCPRRSYPAFAQKWAPHGAEKLLQLHMIKNAIVGDVFWYPPDLLVTMPDGKQLPWRDVVRELGDNRLSGSSLVLPSKYDDKGNKLVDYQPPQGIPGSDQIFTWRDGLNEAILMGADVPIEVVKASETGSGYSGRSIPFMVVLSNCTQEATEIVQAVDDFWIRPLAWLNFGGEPEYEIEPKSLVESFAADAGGSPMGGSAIGGQPGQRLGMSGGQQPGMPQRTGDGSAIQFGEGESIAFGESKTLRAPPGGVTIHGVFYEGGQFIPKEVIGALTPQEQSQLKAGSIARHIRDNPELSEEYRDKKGEQKEAGANKKFGKSKAAISIGDDPQSGQVTAKNISQFFASAKVNAKPEDIASLVGAPDDAIVKADFHARHGVIVNVDHPAYKADYFIKKTPKGKASIYIEGFWVKDQQQGKGLGSDVFARQVENAKDAGVAYIDCHAAKLNPRDKDKPHAGYYSWPRFGFDQDLDDPDIPREDYAVFSAARKKFPEARSVLDIFATKEGRDWWKANGTDLYAARFDMQEPPPSRSLKILRYYLEEREKMKTEHKAAVQMSEIPAEILISDLQEAALERAWARLDREGAMMEMRRSDSDSQFDEQLDLIDSISARPLAAASRRIRTAAEVIRELKKTALTPAGLSLAIENELRNLQPLIGADLSASMFGASLAGSADVVTGVPEPLAVPPSPVPGTPPPIKPPAPPSAASLLFPDGEPPGVRFPAVADALEVLHDSPVAAGVDYHDTAARVREGAFAVTGDLTDAAVADVRDILAKTIEEGGSVDDFADAVIERLGDEGGGPLSEPHLQTIFRTNTAAALSDGQNRALSQPMVADAFPYRAYFATTDRRVRETHIALERLGLNGTNIYRADDPTWEKFRPPWDFNCRCSWSPVTVEQAARRGVTEAKEWLARAQSMADERGGTADEYLSRTSPPSPEFVPPPDFAPPAEFERR